MKHRRRHRRTVVTRQRRAPVCRCYHLAKLIAKYSLSANLQLSMEDCGLQEVKETRLQDQ